MPRGDQTGPRGFGPMTGRRMGRCFNEDRRNLGRGRRNSGLGRKICNRATLGAGLGLGLGFAFRNANRSRRAAQFDETFDEKDILSEEKAQLEAELAAVNNELENL